MPIPTLTAPALGGACVTVDTYGCYRWATLTGQVRRHPQGHPHTVADALIRDRYPLGRVPITPTVVRHGGQALRTITRGAVPAPRSTTTPDDMSDLAQAIRRALAAGIGRWGGMP